MDFLGSPYQLNEYGWKLEEDPLQRSRGFPVFRILDGDTLSEPVLSVRFLYKNGDEQQNGNISFLRNYLHHLNFSTHPVKNTHIGKYTFTL